MNIHWYPGHMAKAKRLLQENIKLMDIIIEILDARIPKSSHNPDLESILNTKKRIIVLNKSDLADRTVTAQWVEWYKEQGTPAVDFSAFVPKGRNRIINLIMSMMKDEVERLKAEKKIHKTIRVMVVGIPNVGKSTFINQIAGGNRAKTGDKPGVTKGKQWIKVGPYLELMDTPGLLWPKLEDPDTARHLAFVGSIKEEIMDMLALCSSLLEELAIISPQGLLERYKLSNLDGKGYDVLESICRKRGWIMSGGVPDVERGAKIIIDEFRSQKIGKISLEHPDHFNGEG